MPTLEDLELELGDFILDTWYDDLVEYLREKVEPSPFDYYGYVTKDLIPSEDVAINLGIPIRRFKEVHSGYVAAGDPITDPSAVVDVNSDHIRIRGSRTPANSSDIGNAGDICWDSDYIYVCVAANTWKRAAISTWP
jgi:hypothetical protein